MTVDGPRNPGNDGRFRQLAENLPQIVFIADEKGVVNYINQQWQEVFGVPPERVLEDFSWTTFIHPDDVDEALERWLTAVERGEPYYDEYRFLSKDGDYRWFLSRALPQRDSDGRIIAWHGTATDIHELHEIQQALSAREADLARRLAELRAIYDGVPVGLCQFDRNMRFVEINEALARFNGVPVANHIGRTPREIVPQFADRIERLLRQVLSTGEPVENIETVGELPGNPGVEGHWLSTYQPILSHDKILGVAVILVDITDLRRAQEAQEALQSQLYQAQKMEAIGQLTAGVAHDFNNMLAVISGNLELLEERKTDRPDLTPLLKTAQEAVERGANLTRSLLAFSRRQPLHPQVTDVSALVEDMADLLRGTLGEGMKVTVRVEAGCRSWIDPAQLENAIINLAVNARDAMPQGGQVMIEVDRAVLDTDYAMQNPEVLPGGYVAIAVSDTGSGMSPEVIERAFDPFFTTKEVGAGTGLGLSMVYGFVKQSGGHLKIYSEAGSGSTVKLYLPLSDRSAPSQTPAPAPVSLADMERKTVLLVEDDPQVRKSVEALLESLDYTVLSAETVAEAGEHLTGPAEIDLLLTDVMLPGGLRGPDLAARAQSGRPDLKVIYMSGYTENSVLERGVLQAGAPLLQKPFRKSDLMEKIQSVFEGEGRTG